MRLSVCIRTRLLKVTSILMSFSLMLLTYKIAGHVLQNILFDVKDVNRQYSKSNLGGIHLEIPKRPNIRDIFYQTTLKHGIPQTHGQYIPNRSDVRGDNTKGDSISENDVVGRKTNADQAQPERRGILDRKSARLMDHGTRHRTAKVSGPKVLPFSQFRYPIDTNFTELIRSFIKTGASTHKPINVYPYTFIKPMENICKSQTEIFLLFLIKSAPGNFNRRLTIRESWTNGLYFKNDNIRHVFLLGQTQNQSMNAKLTMENSKYHDMVEITFIDAYFNNTYKTIGGIIWSVRFCPKTNFVMLVDDDFYVATDRLLTYLHKLPKSTAQSLFAGRVWYDVPQRRPEQKWYMSVTDYPYDKYPPFVSAGATIMSMEFVRKLQIAIMFTKHFKFDDVFLAIVAYKLGVKPIHHPEIHIAKRVSYLDKMFKNVLAAHNYGNTTELRLAWQAHLKTIKM